jgi:hypothetical protein
MHLRKIIRRPRRRKLRRNVWHPSRLAAILKNLRPPKRALRAFAGAPKGLQAAVVIVLLGLLWFVVNGLYQVIRKPSELFFPVSGTLNKTPSATWRQYGPLFRKFSTDIMTPDLLAALAQVEGSGNPVARTYWRWSLSSAPFDVYRPASSAVGMYQITNGTFAEARKLCIRGHRVVDDGTWNDWNSCWFNSLYTRVIPSHAVELTAAYLDRRVSNILDFRPVRGVSLERKQDLAALIHLCGAGAGDIYVRHGMRLAEGQRCGDHDARDYIARVDAAKREFRVLSREE